MKINRIHIVLALAALILGFVAWRQGGVDLVLGGLFSGGRTLVSVIPLLIAAFMIAGLIQALVRPEMVTRWLGYQAGWRGIALACLGGALIPGGPYVYYPIAAALMHAGAGLGVLVAFVTAKNLWSVTRLPLEFALLGPRLTLVRILVTFILPPLVGFMADWFFGAYIERIQKAAKPT